MQTRAGSEAGLDRRFEPTYWSVVLAASRETAPGDVAQVAPAELCRACWSPLHGFVRGRGYSVHDAQDLTQGFFAHLIEHRIYARTNQTKGKFRSFLLAEEQVTVVEALFQGSTAFGVAAPEDYVFERQWAEALVAVALGRLAAEGKERLFKASEIFVRGSAETPPSYDELARRLEMPAVTARSHVNRLRARYRALVRTEPRRTVGSEDAVDEELHELLRALSTR